MSSLQGDNKILCRGTACGTEDSVSYNCVTAQLSWSAKWWSTTGGHRYPTQPSQSEGGQRPSAGKWHACVPGNFLDTKVESHRIFTSHGILFIWLLPSPTSPQVVKNVKPFFAQGLYKNGWQTRLWRSQYSVPRCPTFVELAYMLMAERMGCKGTIVALLSVGLFGLNFHCLLVLFCFAHRTLKRMRLPLSMWLGSWPGLSGACIHTALLKCQGWY